MAHDSPQPFEGACRIDDWGVIRARGADAATFLQGQLTNDVLGLDAGRCPARRLLLGEGPAAGELRRLEGGRRRVPARLLGEPARATLKRLSMFVLRAKCKLSDASARSCSGGSPAAPRPPRSATPRPGEARARWRRGDPSSRRRGHEPSALRRSSGIEPAAAPALALAAWRWLEVRSGIVTIEAATVDRFVPQMVNFELVGGVDFQKGCYPGQEVVARSQYRGTTKRRTFLFDGAVVAQPGPGRVPRRRRGRAGGHRRERGAGAEGGGSALVELRLAALGDGELRLGSIDGPVLQRAALPYPVALDAEATA
jgi:folate-binding protein YgfZ